MSYWLRWTWWARGAVGAVDGSGATRWRVLNCKQKKAKNDRQKNRAHVTYVTDYQTYSPIETTCCSNMVKLFRCNYCTHVFPSMQGWRSHLAQVKKCRQKWVADLDKMCFHPQNLFKGRSNDDNQTAGMGEPQTAMTQFWSEKLIIPISQNKQMNQNQQMNPLSMKRAQRNVLVTKTPIDVLHHPEHNGRRTSLIKQASTCAESLPCLNLCIMLRLPEGNQYGGLSQMRRIGSWGGGYLSQEQHKHPRMSFCN